MPIRPKAEVEARRAAAAALAAEFANVAVSATPLSAPPLQSNPAAADPAPPAGQAAASPPRRRGHATRDENDKWQPTGDYEKGWCRPPVQGQFKKGGKPGPGRPKGSVSHDTLLKRELDQLQPMRINGREQKLPMRHVVVKQTVRAAVEGKDKDARKHVLAEIARLYPTENQPDAPGQTTDLSASDALSMEEFMAELRRDVRAELERELAVRDEKEAE